ncbi:MAG: hypothetical protein QM820_35800 [Minicystis sp.]
MTKRRNEVLAAVIAGVLGLGAGCGEKSGGTPAPTSTATTSAAPTTSAAVSATASAAVSATATAEPSADATASAEPEPARKWDCGAKRQKPCPMQGWMKKVMAPASSSGDGEKLAEALTYASKRPPPGYADWVTISKEGIAKAKAGDIDGAKASCKKCHDAYKEDYKAKMRDRAW